MRSGRNRPKLAVSAAQVRAERATVQGRTRCLRPNLSEHVDLERTYALNDEGGVVVATYPLGKRPEIPFPYFGEIWTGLDYQFAASLAFEGMTTEALSVVESVRGRHDGERRNPWNEHECGHHYARALASWACFVAWSGFGYSAPQRELTLMPRARRQAFRCFWSVPSGWGSFTHTLKPQEQRVAVQVAEGSIAVQRLAVNGVGKSQFKKVSARLGTEAPAGELANRNRAARYQPSNRNFGDAGESAGDYADCVREGGQRRCTWPVAWMYLPESAPLVSINARRGISARRREGGGAG